MRQAVLGRLALSKGEAAEIRIDEHDLR
jgi:hypothetical protein